MHCKEGLLNIGTKLIGMPRRLRNCICGMPCM